MEPINFIELAKLLISFAILAPSGHNSQPWQFQVADNEIIITPDFSKRLDVVDGNDRELFIPTRRSSDLHPVRLRTDRL